MKKIQKKHLTEAAKKKASSGQQRLGDALANSLRHGKKKGGSKVKSVFSFCK